MLKTIETHTFFLGIQFKLHIIAPTVQGIFYKAHWYLSFLEATYLNTIRSEVAIYSVKYM